LGETRRDVLFHPKHRSTEGAAAAMGPNLADDDDRATASLAHKAFRPARTDTALERLGPFGASVLRVKPARHFGSSEVLATAGRQV
jgi:hypothetical protein